MLYVQEKDRRLIITKFKEHETVLTLLAKVPVLHMFIVYEGHAKLRHKSLVWEVPFAVNQGKNNISLFLGWVSFQINLEQNIWIN